MSMNAPRPLRWPRLALGLAVTAVFAWLAFRGVDWTQARTALAGLAPRWLGAALVALAVDYLLRITRWWRMLVRMGATVPLKRCAAPFLAAIALNNLLPFRAGDVARTVAFTGELGLPIPAILATMIAERLLDLAALLLLLALGVSRLPPGTVPEAAAAGAWIIAAVCAAGVIGIALIPAKLLAGLRGAAEKPGFAGRFASFSADAGAALIHLRTPRAALEMIALSMLIWLGEGAVFAAVGTAQRLDLGYGAWFACSLGTLATLLPASPGYVGTFDYFTIRSTSAWGIDAQAGALFAMVVHLVLWLPLTLAGLAALLVTTVPGRAPRSAPSR